MLIVVLGGGISLTAQLPLYVYQRLDKALEIYNQNKKKLKIVVSGGYSFLYHQLGKFPPITEAEKMAQYLKEKGVSYEDILIEKKSKDTISNAYYLKKDVFLPKNEKKAYVITSKFHLPRVKYIFRRVFGQNYQFVFIGIKEKIPKEKEKQILERQKQILLKIKKILSPMKEGNHLYLKGKFYKLKYYKEKRPSWVINFVAQGK